MIEKRGNVTTTKNIFPPGPREYLHTDKARIDSYFEQISDPVKYDKVPVWKVGLKLTGPSAEGSQDRPGRPFTIHEKIDAIVKHLQKEKLLDAEMVGAFKLEKRTVTQVFIPIRDEKLGKEGSIRAWISLKSEEPNQQNNLILLEDSPVPDDSKWYPSATAYTALLLLRDGIEQGSNNKALVSPLKYRIKTGNDPEEKFAEDPIGYLEELGGRVGARRDVVSLYRVRIALTKNDLRRADSDWIVGYSIFIVGA